MPALTLREYRWRALDLIPPGKTVAATAQGLGISEACLRRWTTQDDVDPAALRN